MKRITLIAISLFFFVGCDLEELNENPNVPLDVPLSTLLPPTQKSLADNQGGVIFRYSNIFSQQMTGVEGRDRLADVYNPDELEVGNPWNDFYVNSMVNLRVIIDKADDEGSPHYAGIARIQMAICLGMLTDFWGDIPYSQALQGEQFPNPVYDGQEEIYDDIFELLTRSIVDLSQEVSVFSPGPDDLFYFGNLDGWKRVAQVLQARYHLHLTKVDPNAATAAAEALNEGGFTSSSDEMLYSYLATGTDINPISAFYTNSPQRAKVDSLFVNLLEERSDPRIDFIFRSIPFTGGTKKPGDYYSLPGSPMRVVSYIEFLFLQTEIALRNGIGDASSLLDEAITYSMNELSTGQITTDEIATYLATNAQLTGDFEEDLNTIITEKHTALFTSMEPWTDFRRTGYPELIPNAVGESPSNPNGEIPRRLIYPQSERLGNTSFPQPAPNMQDRFWWDQ